MEIMEINDTHPLDKIRKRICDLQHSYVSLEEKFKINKNNFDQQIVSSALRIVDILDMIELTQSSLDNMGESNSSAKIIISKIEKRLISLLSDLQVHEKI